MFVAVYRWRIRPEAEAEAAFAADWRTITLTAREHGGALGSALFKATDGSWAAIARWPDRGTREAFFASDVLPPDLLARQQAAVLERLPVLELDLIDDQWVPL